MYILLIQDGNRPQLEFKVTIAQMQEKRCIPRSSPALPYINHKHIFNN